MADERSAGALSGRRILVISNETVTGTVLHQAIRFRAHNVSGEVLVVAPALNSRLRHWMSDVDGARRAAEERLKTRLERLDAAGVGARGEIGDGDPLQAIADALSVFPADEIIIATHPEERSHWLPPDPPGGPSPCLAPAPRARPRPRSPQPILHIVVDVARHEEYVAPPAPTLTAS